MTDTTVAIGDNRLPELAAQRVAREVPKMEPEKAQRGNDIAKFTRVFKQIGGVFIRIDDGGRLTPEEMTADSIASYDAALQAMRGRA